ncbi:MAG: Fic family protein [FCB group bacterium]|jgi:Fic family protein
MNSELKNIIERIDQLKAEVDALRPMKPEQEQRLLQKVRLDWNYHSSKIEGNTLSYGETKALLLWGITAQGKPLRDHLEMKGHNEAVEYIMDILKGKEIPITEHFIREFHKIIIPEEYFLDAKTPDGLPAKRKITPGQYKTMPNHVETPTGEIFYFASPEETPAKMMDLMNWYKKECEEKKDHPLIIASMFHYQFLRIHPFDDGNGRMSRLLMNLILMQFGYPPAIVQTERREDYINSLQYADADDFDKFIIFIGERLIESLELWLKAAKGEAIDEVVDMEKVIKNLNDKIDGKK